MTPFKEITQVQVKYALYAKYAKYKVNIKYKAVMLKVHVMNVKTIVVHLRRSTFQTQSWTPNRPVIHLTIIVFTDLVISRNANK